MRAPEWLRRGGLDGLYLLAAAVTVVQLPVETLLGAAAIGFGLVVLLGDWAELRVSLPVRRRWSALLALATVPMLGLWVGLIAVAETDLQLYFALAGGVFFLQAGRDVLVFERGPIELLRRGYPNLVGVCLVCSMLADPLIQFRVTLLALVAGTFVVRKAFVWRGLLGGED